ncbi:MAG: DMT family transporter [Rhizobiaceae bacterium]|nr:DMT family transporter [Rhizobiaceae bacterium]
MPARFIPPVFVLLWATGFLGARYAMPWSEPFTFLAVRFALAFAIIAILALALSRTRLTWRQAGQAAIAGVLIHGVYLGGVFWAVHRGLPAGISALIAGLQPLVTSVLAGWLLKERIAPRQWLGLATGLVGVVVVLWPKLGVTGAGINTATLTASAVAVLAISSGTVWQKKFGAGVDLLGNAAWQYVGATLVMALGSALFETRTVTLNGELVFALLWLTLVLSIGAIFLLMRMIREGEMARVSSLFYLVPSVTAVIAWYLFGETLTPVQIAGMAVATIGVALATRGGFTTAKVPARALPESG